MGYYEHHKIKLQLVNLGYKTIEEYAKEFLNENLSDYATSYTEELIDSFNHYILGDKLYKAIEFYERPITDLFECKQTKPGELELDLCFHNGGCGLVEAIETAYNTFAKENPIILFEQKTKAKLSHEEIIAILEESLDGLEDLQEFQDGWEQDIRNLKKVIKQFKLEK